ncbi:MAG: TetR/AcrR family transcriptional regulator [Gemmatimonadales bacterium]
MDSRTRIETAALAEFAAFGIDGARVARIAERAQVNKQLLYYYHGSKEGLFASVVNNVSRSLEAQGPTRLDADNPVERVRGRLQIITRHLDSYPEHTAVIVAALGERHQRSAPIRSAVRGLAAQVDREISAAQGMGFFRDDVDPHMASIQAITLLLGYFSLRSVLDRTAATPREWAASVGDLVIRALSW